MGNRKIDAVLRLRDEFTKPFGKSISLMTSMDKEGNKVRRQIDKMGKSITSVGKMMTASFTVPIVGAAVASVKTAADFEKSMSQVAASMGTTVDAIPEIAEEAKRLGANTSFSAVEAAEGFNILAQAGLDAQEQIAALAPILDLAAAGSLDMGSAASYVTGAVMGFGDEMANAQKYADMIAKGATQAKTDVNMLGTAFSDASSIAKTYGQSADTTMVTLLRLAQANVTGSEAATSYQRVLSRLYAPTDTAAKAMKELGISAYDNTGAARDLTDVITDMQSALGGLSAEQANAYQKTILGQQGMTAFAKIAATSGDSVSKFYGAMADSGGSAAQQAGTMLDNLSGQITLLKSAIEGVAISFGDKLLPYVKRGVTWVQSLADKVNGLSDEQVDMIIKIAGIVAVAGPAVTVFGKMVSATAGLAKGMGMLRSAFLAVQTAGGILPAVIGAIASPAAIAIAAVAGIAAVVAVVITHLDQFKAAAGSAWSVIDPSVEKIKTAFSGLFEAVGPIIGWISDLIATGLVGAIEMAAEPIGIAIDGIAGVIQGLADIIGGVVDTISGFLNGEGVSAFQHFGRTAEGVLKGIRGVANTIGGAVGAVVGAVEGAAGAVTGIKKTSSASAYTGKYIGANASGTDYWRGGLTSINERGGEIIDLPRGTRIYPHDESVAMAKAGGSITIAKLADSIVVREDADIDRIADAIVRKLQKARERRGGYSYRADMA